MQNWTAVGVVIEGTAIAVGGVNPWRFKWIRVHDEAVDLPHPAYPHERHRFWVYEIENGGRQIRFAAGELSPNVWGFYVPGG